MVAATEAFPIIEDDDTQSTPVFSSLSPSQIQFHRIYSPTSSLCAVRGISPLPRFCQTISLGLFQSFETKSHSKPSEPLVRKVSITQRLRRRLSSMTLKSRANCDMAPPVEYLSPKEDRQCRRRTVSSFSLGSLKGKVKKNFVPVQDLPPLPWKTTTPFPVCNDLGSDSDDDSDFGSIVNEAVGMKRTFPFKELHDD